MTDSTQVANTLERATRIHLELHRAIGERRGTQQDGRITGSTEPQTPINLDAMDQRDLISDQIIGWARIAEEESGEECPRFVAQSAGRWMVDLSEWIAGADWAPDMIEELRQTIRRSEAMLGQLPKRTALTVPCECGARQWIIHEAKVFVKCAEGHESPLASHSALPSGAPVTVTQAARLLDLARSTIGSLIKRGVIHAEGEPPTIERHEIVKFQERLASDQGWR